MSYKRYAPNGGKGNTHLIGGQTISKNSLRMHVLGELDELNSWLGMIGGLDKIQTQLMFISAYIAQTDGVVDKQSITKSIKELEDQVEEIWAKLPPLQNFVLPGGSKKGGRLHLARAVCRRVERQVIALLEEEKVDEEVILYLNRLSDWLFVQARYVNFKAGVVEKKFNQHKN